MFRDDEICKKKCEIYQKIKVEQNILARLIGERIVEQPWTVVSVDIIESFLPDKKICINIYVH